LVWISAIETSLGTLGRTAARNRSVSSVDRARERDAFHESCWLAEMRGQL
jgi:hypothetical protein